VKNYSHETITAKELARLITSEEEESHRIRILFRGKPVTLKQMIILLMKKKRRDVVIEASNLALDFLIERGVTLNIHALNTLRWIGTYYRSSGFPDNPLKVFDLMKEVHDPDALHALALMIAFHRGVPASRWVDFVHNETIGSLAFKIVCRNGCSEDFLEDVIEFYERKALFLDEVEELRKIASR
jgi:hypothetical protein